MRSSKTAVHARVAAVLGVSPIAVSRVMTLFLEEAAHELARTGELTLPYLGRFRLKQGKGRPAQLAYAPGAPARTVEANDHLKVYFSRSDYLRDTLNRKHRR